MMEKSSKEIKVVGLSEEIENYLSSNNGNISKALDEVNLRLIQIYEGLKKEKDPFEIARMQIRAESLTLDMKSLNNHRYFELYTGNEHIQSNEFIKTDLQKETEKAFNTDGINNQFKNLLKLINDNSPDKTKEMKLTQDEMNYEGPNGPER